MQTFLQRSFLLLFLSGGFFSSAQVRFSASITPSVIGKNEYAQLKLTVENAGEVQQIDPPQLKNFTVVGGPNQESGMSMVNGNVKKYIALSYILKPAGTGNFLIPPATAKADGATYRSNAVTIKVINGSTGNAPQSAAPNNPFAGMGLFDDPEPRTVSRDFILKKGEDPRDKINRNMFVTLEVDRKTCYVGEPVVATYKLYTRLKSESNITKNPSFNGFSVIDLQPPDNTNYRVEKKDGREYNVYTVRKVQLYPLLPGQLELGSAEIENNVHFIKAEYINQHPGPFDGMMQDFSEAMIPPEGMEDLKVTLQNKPVTILVKPLPEENKPAGFKGAVGHFDIETKVENNDFTTDDDGKMAVIISGEGNLQLINAPDIAWPEGIEAFDPKATDDLYKGTVPVGGRKIFEFPFTVSKPGTYTIPALSFGFFDPKQNMYRSVESKPIQITVTKGAGKPKVSAVTPVKEDSLLAGFFRNRLRVVSVVAVLIIFGLIFWLKKDVKKEKQVAIENDLVNEKPVEEIIQAQQNPFAQAAEQLQTDDGKSFYITLNEELKNHVSRKLSIPAEELNRRSIAAGMDKLGISHETAIQLYNLIDEIEFQLYTPIVENGKRKILYDKANEIAQLLNTYHTQV